VRALDAPAVHERVRGKRGTTNFLQNGNSPRGLPHLMGTKNQQEDLIYRLILRINYPAPQWRLTHRREGANVISSVVLPARTEAAYARC
jgi:hypothetical protein